MNQDHLTEIIKVVEREKLYRNLKKCSFFTSKVTFLGHIVTAECIDADEAKIEAIWSRPMPQSIDDVRCFHRLASFYIEF